MNHLYKHLKVLFTMAVCLGLAGSAHAQLRVVHVEPGYGTLNEAIANEANPDEVIFEMERGGVYEITASIEYDGEILRLHGEEGDGPRPILQAVVDITGVAPDHFHIRSSLELESVVLLGIDDFGVDVRNPIRMQKDSTRIVANNTLFETAGQSFIRFDAAGMDAFITNCVVRNVGITDSPGNGRFLDTRGQDVDTLFIQNTTIYQHLDRTIRSDGSFIRYFYWDHNTVFNAGNIVIPLGRAVEARISNSIFHNVITRGNDDEYRPAIEMDSLGTVYDFTDADRHIVLANLDIVTEQKYWDALPDTVLMGWSPYRTWWGASGEVTEREIPGEPLHPRFGFFLDAGIADTFNIFAEELDFENPPPDMIDYAVYYQSGGTTDFPAWRAYEDPAAYDDPTVVGELPENAFNLTYNTSARAYTAASNGFPLGDLNWYPEIKEEWVQTGAERGTAGLAGRFRLHGNYPNPFNANTTIVFDVAQASRVAVIVYDLRGREVLAVPATTVAAGSGHKIELNASALGSGVYVYRVVVHSSKSTEAQSGRMVLLK